MYINLGNGDYKVKIGDSELPPLGPYVLDVSDAYSMVTLYLDKAQLIELCNGIMEYLNENN